MKEIDFIYVNDFIRKQLALIGSKLGTNAREGIFHYLNIGEYEMAFEGMFIDLMKLQEKPDMDFKECMTVAKLLNLDKETVFDANFWPQFEAYINERNA